MAAAVSLCPELDFYYFADYLNMPLGQRSRHEVVDTVVHRVARLAQKFGTGVVVIACNTATSLAIGALRESLPDIEFVGTEPALQPAFLAGYSRVILAATPNTIKYNRLVRRTLSPDTDLILLPMPDLAQMVEKNIADLDMVVSKIAPQLVQFVTQDSCLVLGCTHYVLLKNRLQTALRVPCIDGNMGVARRLNSVAAGALGSGKITLCTNDKSRQNNLKVGWQICLQEV